MATTPVNPSGGAGTPPGSGAPPSPQGGGGGGNNPLQLIAAITRLAQMLAQAAPPASAEAENIIREVQNAARKIMPAQNARPGQQSPF